MIRLFFAWLFLAVFFWLFIAAANGARWLWLHVHWPPHRQRMRRAQLCLEVAHHWQRDSSGFVARQFRRQAYQLCERCGCPADLWPAGVLAIHVEVR